ncbi:hypothetical protein Pelo_4304 [Pelomyxa schiedti]|nr:hypothetical protein Pelo_4304 [Pelomyxa schiedti]
MGIVTVIIGLLYIGSTEDANAEKQTHQCNPQRYLSVGASSSPSSSSHPHKRRNSGSPTSSSPEGPESHQILLPAPTTSSFIDTKSSRETVPIPKIVLPPPSNSGSQSPSQPRTPRLMKLNNNLGGSCPTINRVGGAFLNPESWGSPTTSPLSSPLLSCSPPSPNALFSLGNSPKLSASALPPLVSADSTSSHSTSPSPSTYSSSFSCSPTSTSSSVALPPSAASPPNLLFEALQECFNYIDYGNAPRSCPERGRTRSLSQPRAETGTPTRPAGTLVHCSTGTIHSVVVALGYLVAVRHYDLRAAAMHILYGGIKPQIPVSYLYQLLDLEKRTLRKNSTTITWLREYFCQSYQELPPIHASLRPACTTTAIHSEESHKQDSSPLSSPPIFPSPGSAFSIPCPSPFHLPPLSPSSSTTTTPTSSPLNTYRKGKKIPTLPALGGCLAPGGDSYRPPTPHPNQMTQIQQLSLLMLATGSSPTSTTTTPSRNVDFDFLEPELDWLWGY